MTGLAHFQLQGQQVQLNGPLIHKRGLLPQLFLILCHEIGHYACCPGSDEAHAQFCARAFAALESESGQTALVVNLYQDLLINTRLQLEKKLDMVPLLQALRPALPDAFWNWVLRIHEIRWRLPGQTLCWQPAEPVAEADALLAARLIQPRSRSPLEAMHGFAELCRPYLPPEKIAMPWLDQPAPQAGGQPAGLTNRAALAPEAGQPRLSGGALRQYLEPPAYAALLAQAGASQQDWLGQYYRERAWPYLLSELKPTTDSYQPQHPEGTRPWELDRPVTDIDWTASLIQSPVVVPGMTTLRRQQAWEHEPEAKHELPQRLDLYLDASGSLPNPASTCSPLVLAATILVLSALRLGLQVRVTSYSGPEQILSTGFSRQGPALLRTLTSYFGAATSFPLPLLSTRYAQPQPVSTRLMLLSDEGYQAALMNAPDGEAGSAILQRAAAQATGAILLLQLLRPQIPAELKPLLASGWQLKPLPDSPAGLARQVF